MGECFNVLLLPLDYGLCDCKCLRFEFDLIMQIQQHGLEHSLRLDDGYVFDGGTVRVALNVDTIPVIAFVLVLGIGLIACESL